MASNPTDPYQKLERVFPDRDFEPIIIEAVAPRCWFATTLAIAGVCLAILGLAIALAP